jgi:poly(3-hydroxybutyrate) depolymerase
MVRKIAALILALAAAPVAQAAEPIAVGASRIEVAEPSGVGHLPMAVHLHRPAAWRATDCMLVVLHGQGRNADGYRDAWVTQAESAGLLLVVPEFSNAKYPGRSSYNFGGVVDAAGVGQARDKWVFGAIDRVVAEVRRRTGATRDRYILYGHSAGAQFVHRYLLLAEASNAEVIVSANAGSYTFPTADVPFPWGLTGVAVGDADLARAFARPVVILLGDQDIDPNHRSLPRDPQAQAQGPHRFARGHAFFAAAEAKAKALGAPFAWRLRVVPGVGHSNAGMAAGALAAFTELLPGG